MKRNLQLTLGLSLLIISITGQAHHSRASFFDMSQTVELEGVITRVQWRHPHVRYWIQADIEYGGEEWEMETTPPSILERMGISPDILVAGTRVRVAGPPSKLVANAMEVSHVLLPDGREVLLHTGRRPLWTENAVERNLQGFEEEAVRAAEASADGIFRVWSRGRDDNRPQFWLDSYPLTEEASAIVEIWDPVTGINTGCAGKDMPWLMSSSWPFEFVNDGESIRLLAEEFDRVRIIHLSARSRSPLHSPLGYSVGHWENGSLIVTTTHISSMSFNGREIPMSREAKIRERFSLSVDKNQLNYEMIVTDPATFTEPVTMNSHWIWRPGETVNLYNCIETPGSWTNVENKTLLEN